jgi:protein-tyrosine-phosphatase
VFWQQPIVSKWRRLELSSDFAGTHPDEAIAPLVAAFLEDQGLKMSHPPRQVTCHDMAKATKIVSMGCEMQDLPLTGEVVERWDDVPPVSQDFEKAWVDIKKKVETLLAQTS